MDNPDESDQLEWNDQKESLRMWTVLTAVFAAFAIIAVFLYVYDATDMQLASNETAPPTSVPVLPNPSVPALPQ